MLPAYYHAAVCDNVPAVRLSTVEASVYFGELARPVISVTNADIASRFYMVIVFNVQYSVHFYSVHRLSIVLISPYRTPRLALGSASPYYSSRCGVTAWHWLYRLRIRLTVN